MVYGYLSSIEQLFRLTSFIYIRKEDRYKLNIPMLHIYALCELIYMLAQTTYQIYYEIVLPACRQFAGTFLSMA